MLVYQRVLGRHGTISNIPGTSQEVLDGVITGIFLLLGTLLGLLGFLTELLQGCITDKKGT